MKIALISILTAWVIGMIIGPLLIPLLRVLKFGQRVRNDGPKGHFKKAGTPTMGGLIFIAAMVGTLMIWTRLSDEALLAAGMVLGFGFLGLLDDVIKVVFKRPLGLKAREKILGQFLLAALLLYLSVHSFERGTDLIVPLTEIKWQAGNLYYLISLILVVGTVNAVNLTDGLDGLAAGSSFLVYLGYVIICLLAVTHSPLLTVDYLELTIFAAALCGGCLAFLFFNRYPAKIFMGDTGSLALGGGIAVLAVLTKTELVLPVLAGVFVLETLSVMLQVLSFRLTGKRIFRMSPLHHHFELLGWRETKVVHVFWTLSALFVFLGLVLVTV
ncbi:phospho-N-acetylmuramoyl-pentapeptide-transferase [Candidatus Formimonas warabiya]|uniref:Phospho-N-acetylmuramoyl-pentapeptide-transferase n=1 Tax=Formimonas warabiya TaxID=1761012 RepID=A0A3G1KRI0_FORW1|nr:phospho-N-acetylmuramoyl-pentapeptide-transferase [Candidatus Formimonas warabiya]ATW25058.1 phospho-N-acetylmuramoyl-pentapeptide-transferase [Candidatus Formimonas warabiya]